VTYSSLTDVQVAAGGLANLVSLTDQSGTQVAVDQDVLTRSQARADAFINGYLRIRYATPLASPSPEIRDMAAEIAVYFLRQAKPGMLGEHQVKEHELRVKWLEDVRAGRIRIDDIDPPKSSAVKSAVVPLGGDITRETLKGMW
jgi:phage gp36-like protein